MVYGVTVSADSCRVTGESNLSLMRELHSPLTYFCLLYHRPLSVDAVDTWGSTYLVRAIPFAAMRKKIENRFIKSFLYYIPYAVLSAMTLPAAFYATGNIISGAVGLAVGGFFAYRGKGLTFVAVVSCAAAFLAECVIRLVAQ